VSQFVLDRFVEQRYFRDVPIKRVIHNARDPWELGVNAATTRPAGASLRFGYIGRLDSSKGIEQLLEAFCKAAPADAQLWIAGGGRSDYEQSLRNRWASERVRFLGHVAQRDFYPEVDAVVVPSLWEEPLGMVVAESMSFGKPVIGARRGGIPEMIKSGENGLLFEPDNDAELRGAIQRLAQDPALRLRMGEAARTSAAPFLDRVGWVDKYVGLYAEVSRTQASRHSNVQPGPSPVSRSKTE
jgi:glycosyltransferase involved in cell wall biosynthesis